VDVTGLFFLMEMRMAKKEIDAFRLWKSRAANEVPHAVSIFALPTWRYAV